MTETTQDSVLDAISGLAEVLSLALALVRSGRRIDLAGLEGEVASLCGAATSLSDGQGRAVLPDLAELLERLDELAAMLRP